MRYVMTNIYNSFYIYNIYTGQSMSRTHSRVVMPQFPELSSLPAQVSQPAQVAVHQQHAGGQAGAARGQSDLASLHGTSPRHVSAQQTEAVH